MPDTAVKTIPIAFHSMSKGAIRQRFAGINAIRHADNSSGEQWEIPTIKLLRGVPKEGDRIIPVEGDRRPRTVLSAAIVGPADEPTGYLVTCPILPPRS